MSLRWSRHLVLAVLIASPLSCIAQAIAPSYLLSARLPPQSRVLLLDIDTGKLSTNFKDTQQQRFAPGSTLKPFILLAALQDGVVREQSQIECHGQLTVQGRNLACTHPRELHIFTAQQALAYSCNQYFAAVASRMRFPDLLHALETFGLRPTARDGDADERILMALGLAGVRVTPLQLAKAYRQLALQVRDAGNTQESQASLQLVQGGMFDSVQYGMAHNAATAGISLAGKTGTASESGQAWTHGWFAGIVYDTAARPRQVIVIYLPHASGADSALLAHHLLAGDRR